MLQIPFLLFLILLYLGREELGFKWILILFCACLILPLGFSALGISPYFFTAILAIVDVVLIMIIFGGNITIR